MTVLFNGRYLVTPTVASQVDDSQMYPMNNPTGNVLLLIGEATAGKPKTGLRIRSPQHAKQMLKSGPLYDAVIKAFSPSSATGSPAIVYAVRVEPAQQSQLILKDAAGNDALLLKSTDYGAYTNSLEIRLHEVDPIRWTTTTKK